MNNCSVVSIEVVFIQNDKVRVLPGIIFFEIITPVLGKLGKEGDRRSKDFPILPSSKCVNERYAGIPLILSVKFSSNGK